MALLSKESQHKSLEELVVEAQNTNRASREFLLETYRPFIIHTASRCCKRFLQSGDDEEISVAMIAFNEAIDSYRHEAGGRFLSFAGLVIRRRLTDYFRQNTAVRREIPFSDFGTDGEDTIPQIIIGEAEKLYSEQETLSEQREEIETYCDMLAKYNITIDELVEISPKHTDARKRAVLTAQSIAENREWVEYFLLRRELPLKEIDGCVPVSRKTLERQRKYIIALILVFLGDFPYLREYLKGDGLL